MAELFIWQFASPLGEDLRRCGWNMKWWLKDENLGSAEKSSRIFVLLSKRRCILKRKKLKEFLCHADSKAVVSGETVSNADLIDFSLTITFLRKFWPGTTLQHHWSMQFQQTTILIDQQTTILVASLLSPSVTQVIGHRTIASSPLDILLADKTISWVGRCILFHVDISCKTPDCTSFNIFKLRRAERESGPRWHLRLLYFKLKALFPD